MTYATTKAYAKKAGYYVREGSYHGTTDDRIGRWYVGHVKENGFRPWGAGYPTKGAAWTAAAELANEQEMLDRIDNG